MSSWATSGNGPLVTHVPTSWSTHRYAAEVERGIAGARVGLRRAGVAGRAADLLEDGLTLRAQVRERVARELVGGVGRRRDGRGMA